MIVVQNGHSVNEGRAWPVVETQTVSVAMCTYNGAAFLQEQLSSMAEQSLKPIELVVCDDRSSDDTFAILKAFQQVAPFPVRIYVNSVQLGTTRNFDKAMRLCMGEFIALSDQDDLWRQNKLETLVDLLCQHPTASGAFSDAVLIDDLSKPTGNRLWQKFRFTRSKQKLFLNQPAALLLKHDVVTGATLMIRASLLNTFPCIPASWIHDGWLAWMATLKGGLQMTAQGLTFYRVHGAQQLGIGTPQNQNSKMKELETDRYRRVAVQFNDLLSYTTENTSSKRLATQIEAKRDFLQCRASLPASIVTRLRFFLTHLQDYRRYARGAYSMWKDLHLPRASSNHGNRKAR